jgi:flagellar basal-body rod protein FlgC
VYQAKHPVFQTVQDTQSAQALGAPGQAIEQASASVKVAGIVTNGTAPESRYDPGNPLANADGYVYSSNVNVVEEMTDMISASRAYQNNVEVMNTSKELMMATLKLGS